MEEYLKSVFAINDSFRVSLLAFLNYYGKSCVCEMEHSLEVKQSRLSIALKILTEAGFLSVERVGKWAYYEINLKYDYQEDFLNHIKNLDIKVPEKISKCEIKGE